MMLYDLIQLRQTTEKIIEDLQGREQDLFPNDPINWGDLHCVEASFVQTDDGREYYRVLIEEASEGCQKFPVYIREELVKQGFENIVVATEW